MCRYTRVCMHIHGHSRTHTCMLAHTCARTHASTWSHVRMRLHYERYVCTVDKLLCVCLTGRPFKQTFLCPSSTLPPVLSPLCSPFSLTPPPFSILSSTSVQPLWAQWWRQNQWETICKDDPFLCWLYSPGEEEIPQETESGIQAGRPSEFEVLERQLHRW